MAGAPDKFVLIATGGMLPPDTLDFAPMAKARMFALVTEWNKAIGKKKPPFTLPATVRFVQFDFDSGAVSMHDHVFPDKGTKAPTLDNWTPVAAGGTIDVSTHDNNANSTKTLSITNVYSTVRQSPPDSVLEVSIFSHAFVKGPVLINTSDTSTTSNRDPKDMDGRTKDFNANMGEAAAGAKALENFIKAFDKTGHIRVYGCNVQDVVKNIHIVANVATGGAVRASKVVTITTSVQHGLLNGENCAISDVADATFDGTFTITDVPLPTTFKFAQNAADATSGGGIVSISIDVVANIAAKGAARASNVVTITTTTEHGLAKNGGVRIREVADASFNGAFTITDVPSATTFKFAQNGADAKSGGGILSVSPGVDYKRSAVFQVIDQAFLVPIGSKPLSALGANLRKGKSPTSDVAFDMWSEVMNEAERDVKAQAKDEARAQKKPFAQWEGIENAAWAATPAKRRNKLANELLMMHRQLDPDFYPAPNTTDSTASPAQKTVTKAWADILKLCAKKMAEGYIFQAADKLSASGITCHGAVPGVGGNNEKDPRNLGLMRVCADNVNFGCDDSFGAWLLFYSTFFFLDTDGKKAAGALDDHNYAVLDANTVAIVKKLVGP